MSEESPRSYLEPRFVFVTGNAHKISELETTLAPAWQGYAPGTTACMSDLSAPAPLEDGIIFEENSLTKTRALVEFTGLPALADGSGICIDIMGEVSEIFSACWCGAHGDDAANLNLLLVQLADVPGAHRGAVSVSVAALVFPDGHELVERGEVRDTPIRERRSEGGLGYNPIFVPEGYPCTSAEFSPEEKDAISHWGKAFHTLLPVIIEAPKGK